MHYGKSLRNPYKTKSEAFFPMIQTIHLGSIPNGSENRNSVRYLSTACNNGTHNSEAIEVTQMSPGG